MSCAYNVPSPFDDISLPSGGVILKSSDGVEFKVYKNILALASPFFRDMFTLPQASHYDDEESQPAKDVRAGSGTEVINMTETSSTLQNLLKLIYPVVPPIFSGTESDGTIKDAKAFVDSVGLVLTAALKYQTDIVTKSLLKKLIDAAETTLPDGSIIDDTLALRVFVLACRHGLKDEARDAIHASLKGRVFNVYIPELRYINAAQYYHMIKHHTTALQTVKTVIKFDRNDHPSPYKDWARCRHCTQDDSWSSSTEKSARWWKKFTDDLQKLLTVSPRSSKLFTTAYMQELQDSMCNSNDSYSCYQAKQNWGTMSQYIRDLGDKLEQSISKGTICVDDF